MAKNNSQNPKKRKPFTPNKYQLAVFQAAQDKNGGNIVTEACAGSGKTTMLENLAYLLPRRQKIGYLVFGSRDRKDAQERMPEWLDVVGTHQLGLRAISEYNGNRPEIDNTGKKVVGIIKDLIRETWDNEKWLISPVRKIVSLLKNTLTDVTTEGVNQVVEHYGIETNDSFDRIAELAIEALRLSNKNLNLIDFDDMLYLPVIMNMPIQKFDWVLCDEVQDFNRTQVELTLRAVQEGGRILAVGDENQSVMGFRGADLDSMRRVEERMNCKPMPLSITYRCPLSVVRLVNQVFPSIAFEAAPNAKEGEVGQVSYDMMLGSVRDGDYILCRTNAPLVEPAFELIRKGIKAVILGRDIGKGLVDLIEKFNTKSVTGLLYALTDYRDKEVAKLLAADKSAQAASLDDKVLTIIALSDGCGYVSSIITKIGEVFSDRKEGVIFSTVHKAKGGEAPNVYILNPDQFPHPMATKDWELQQEQNILYVAFTRAKERLLFVGPVAGMPIGVVEEKVEISGEKSVVKEELESKVKEISECPF